MCVTVWDFFVNTCVSDGIAFLRMRSDVPVTYYVYACCACKTIIFFCLVHSKFYRKHAHRHEHSPAFGVWPGLGFGKSFEFWIHFPCSSQVTCCNCVGQFIKGWAQVLFCVWFLLPSARYNELTLVFFCSLIFQQNFNSFCPVGFSNYNTHNFPSLKRCHGCHGLMTMYSFPRRCWLDFVLEEFSWKQNTKTMTTD